MDLNTVKSLLKRKRTDNIIIIAGEEVIVESWSGTLPNTIYLGTHYFPDKKMPDGDIIALFKNVFADPKNPKLKCDLNLLKGIQTRYNGVRAKLLYNVEQEGDRADVRKELHHANELRYLLMKLKAICKPAVNPITDNAKSIPVDPEEAVVEEEISDERIAELIKKFSAIVFKHYKNKNATYGDLIKSVDGVEIPDPEQYKDGKNTASEIIRTNIHKLLEKLLELSTRYEIDIKMSPFDQIAALEAKLKGTVGNLDKKSGEYTKLLELKTNLEVSLNEATGLADEAITMAKKVIDRLGKKEKDLILLYDAAEAAEKKAIDAAKAAAMYAKEIGIIRTNKDAQILALNKQIAALLGRSKPGDTTVTVGGPGTPAPSNPSICPPSPEENAALIQALKEQIVKIEHERDTRISELQRQHDEYKNQADRTAAEARAAANAAATAAQQAAEASIQRAEAARQAAEAKATASAIAAEAAKAEASLAKMEAAIKMQEAATAYARLQAENIEANHTLLEKIAALAEANAIVTELRLQLAARQGQGQGQVPNIEVHGAVINEADRQVEVVRAQGDANLAELKAALQAINIEVAVIKDRLGRAPDDQSALIEELKASRAAAELRYTIEVTKMEDEMRIKEAQMNALRLSESNAKEREAYARTEVARIQGMYDELSRRGAAGMSPSISIAPVITVSPSFSGAPAAPVAPAAPAAPAGDQITQLNIILERAKAEQAAAAKAAEEAKGFIVILRDEIGALQLRLRELIAQNTSFFVFSGGPGRPSGPSGPGGPSGPSKTTGTQGTDTGTDFDDDDSLAKFIRILIINKNTPEPPPPGKEKTITIIKEIIKRIGSPFSKILNLECSPDKITPINPVDSSQRRALDDIKLNKYMANFYSAGPFCLRDNGDPILNTVFYKYKYNTDASSSVTQREIDSKGTVPFIHHIESILDNLYKYGILNSLIKKDTKGVYLDPRVTPGFSASLTKVSIPGVKPTNPKDIPKKLPLIGARYGQVVTMWRLTPIPDYIDKTQIKKGKLEGSPYEAYVFKEGVGDQTYATLPNLLEAFPPSKVADAVAALAPGALAPSAPAPSRPVSAPVIVGQKPASSAVIATRPGSASTTSARVQVMSRLSPNAAALTSSRSVSPARPSSASTAAKIQANINAAAAKAKTNAAKAKSASVSRPGSATASRPASATAVSRPSSATSFNRLSAPKASPVGSRLEQLSRISPNAAQLLRTPTLKNRQKAGIAQTITRKNNQAKKLAERTLPLPIASIGSNLPKAQAKPPVQAQALSTVPEAPASQERSNSEQRAQALVQEGKADGPLHRLLQDSTKQGDLEKMLKSIAATAPKTTDQIKGLDDNTWKKVRLHYVTERYNKALGGGALRESFKDAFKKIKNALTQSILKYTPLTKEELAIKSKGRYIDVDDLSLDQIYKQIKQLGGNKTRKQKKSAKKITQKRR